MQSINKNYRAFTIALLLFMVINWEGCKKLVTVDPPVTGVNSQNVYNTDATAVAALTGIYANMVVSSNSLAAGAQSISTFCGLSADEFTLYSGVSATSNSSLYYKNQLAVNSSPSAGGEFWGGIYGTPLYSCNAAIEGLNASTTLTPAVKQQLLGEAKFMRAFFYFYLANLYGDVPLVISSNYATNASLPRTPKAQVYAQIIQDLKDAQGLLADGYIKADGQSLYANGSEQRLRPCKSAATALLARVYLYTGSNYADAITQASAVISNSSYYSLPALNSVFLANSKEAIWQLQPVVTGHNTEDGWLYVLPSTGPSTSYPVYLSPQLLGSFEAGDLRKVNGNWVNTVTSGGVTYYYPYKYKSATLNAAVTEYTMVLRLGEQYLIRAEAEAQLNQLSASILDLNVIRTRAGLPGTTATTQAALLTAIQHERQVELFSEWGHRWLDLKRTGTVDAVMGAVTLAKGNSSGWNTQQQLYPLPLGDIQKDPALVQNPGY